MDKNIHTPELLPFDNVGFENIRVYLEGEFHPCAIIPFSSGVRDKLYLYMATLR